MGICLCEGSLAFKEWRFTKYPMVCFFEAQRQWALKKLSFERIASLKSLPTVTNME